MAQIIEVPVQRPPKRVFHSGYMPEDEVWIQPPLVQYQATYDAPQADVVGAVAQVAGQGLGCGGSGWIVIDEAGALLLRSSGSIADDLRLELTSGSESGTTLSVQTRSDDVKGLFLSLVRQLDLLLPRQV